MLNFAITLWAKPFCVAQKAVQRYDYSTI